MLVSNAAHLQLHAAFVLISFKNLSFFPFRFFTNGTYQYTMLGIPVVVRAPQLEKP